jgi:hypothetical protein
VNQSDILSSIFYLLRYFHPVCAKYGGNHGILSDRNHKRPASIGTGIMFTRRHYDYLADTIINDPELPGELRQSMYEALGSWFKRDFPNFQWIKWDKVWTDHFR